MPPDATGMRFSGFLREILEKSPLNGTKRYTRASDLRVPVFPARGRSCRYLAKVGV